MSLRLWRTICLILDFNGLQNMTENYPQGFKELQPGTALNGGKYVIEKKIGEGGFGITYKAVQTGLYRAVCIKEYFLAGRCVRNTQAKTVQLQGISEEKYEKFRLAFVKEAQTVATLHHPNIVEVIDIFDENNTSYMVMTFIEGRTLQGIVDTKGPLSYPDAVNYMAQISNAVDYIHKHSILHRDIKPENIMVTPDYKAILIDFGSAREFEQDKTQMHTSMLTHGYAPPEQYTANSRKGSYTDIYALGATFYFILAGRVPLEAAARLTEQLVEPKMFNTSIPPEANQTIMKAMKLKTDERYQRVQDFMDDLKNVHHGAPEIIEDPIQQPKSKWWLLWIIVSVVVLLVGAVATSIIVPKQREYKDKIRQYDDALTKFDESLKEINNPKKLTEMEPVIRSLEELQKIEEMESEKFFERSGKEPCYQEKCERYINEVDDKNAEIYRKIKTCETCDDSSCPYCKDIKVKLELNEGITNELRKEGSAKVVMQKIGKKKQEREKLESMRDHN